MKVTTNKNNTFGKNQQIHFPAAWLKRFRFLMVFFIGCILLTITLFAWSQFQMNKKRLSEEQNSGAPRKQTEKGNQPEAINIPLKETGPTSIPSR